MNACGELQKINICDDHKFEKRNKLLSKQHNSCENSLSNNDLIKYTNACDKERKICEK